MPIAVVLADANVLYSRVFRDYFMYSAIEGLINLKWSPEILDEVSRHHLRKLRNATPQSVQRLGDLMNTALPHAQVQPTSADYAKFANIAMPDEDDRHVLAAAIAAHADVLCTSNVKDFPDRVMNHVGIRRSKPGEILHGLILAHPLGMRQVHEAACKNLPGATSQSTIDTLRRAGARQAAADMTELTTLVLVPAHMRSGRPVGAYLRRH